MNGRITGLSSMATRRILAELSGAYEKATGREVAFTSVGGVDAAKRVRAGEPVDVVLLASGVMKSLEAEGLLIAGGCRDFARSGMAIGAPADGPRPSVEDPAEVRQAVLGARRIAYSTGPSGDHLKAMLETWGVAAEIGPRLLLAPAGVPVGSLLAQGEADLGFQQLSELLGVPGIAILGALPRELGGETIFTAGVASASSQPDAASALIAFLASRDTEEPKRRLGMDPP